MGQMGMCRFDPWLWRLWLWNRSKRNWHRLLT
jgi:hypothetical protein